MASSIRIGRRDAEFGLAQAHLTWCDFSNFEQEVLFTLFLHHFHPSADGNKK